MGKNNEDNAVKPGFVIGRICSLPFKAVIAIGKRTLGFAVRTQDEYNHMEGKSRKEVEDIALGKKYGTTEQKLAAQKYIKDATEKRKSNK